MGRFSDSFFYPSEIWTHAPTTVVILHFWNLFNYAKPLHLFGSLVFVAEQAAVSRPFFPSLRRRHCRIERHLERRLTWRWLQGRHDDHGLPLEGLPEPRRPASGCRRLRLGWKRLQEEAEYDVSVDRTNMAHVSCSLFRTGNAITAQRLFTHIPTTVYSQILIYPADWTGPSWRERKCPIFETAENVIRTQVLSIESPAFYRWATILHTTTCTYEWQVRVVLMRVQGLVDSVFLFLALQQTYSIQIKFIHHISQTDSGGCLQ